MATRVKTAVIQVPINIPHKTKMEVVVQLEDIFKKWTTDNQIGKPRTLSILDKKYTFMSPNELYQFIKGLRLFLEN